MRDAASVSQPKDPFQIVTDSVDISKTSVGKMMNKFFSSKPGIIFVGLFIGVIAGILQQEGNPGNMGFCVACFERDIAGALGLHSAGVVQYLRPEILGFILGAFVAALLFREYRARTGSAPSIRFVLGFFAMIGALVFLGCPWRAFIRLAGGDLNAVLGILGLGAGVWVGSLFIKEGFNLGRSRKAHPIVGMVLPIIALVLLVLVLVDPVFDEGQIQRDAEGNPILDDQGNEISIEKSVLKESISGPGSQYAPLALAFGAALAVGFFAQRSRFCTIAGIRDTILIRDFHLLLGVIALVVGVFVTNLVFGNFELGTEGQPVAHDDGLWNFMGMLLAGLAFALAGGCPGRQLILAGEGDADSTVFVFGMVAGAAFAHNFRTAAGPGGVGDWSIPAVFLGLVVCLAIAYFMRDKV